MSAAVPSTAEPIEEFTTKRATVPALEAQLGQPIPVPDDHYAAFTCFGSFGPGHAPPESLDELVRVTRPGGHGIFNVRSDTYEDQGFAAKFNALSTAGAWQFVETSPDFHPYLLAEPELYVKVFVYRKT